VKIGLYIPDGSGNGVGGAELMMASLADEWSRDHDVDLIHHRPDLTRERIAMFSRDRYDRVNIRCMPREPEPPAYADPLRRFRAAQHWHASVSAGYDLFVNCGHWLPPFCHARIGVLLVLFPFYIRPYDLAEMRALPYWKRLRHRAYYELEWRRRLASYQQTIAISKFARDWTTRRWGVDSTVVYPPVETDFREASKDNLILSISRFNLRARKKQLEMMQAFADLNATDLDGWTYASVGGLNATPDNRAYFDAVGRIGAQCGGSVEANLPRPQLVERLRRARIFWHAMGLDEDTDRHPERAEHFGIATVEAMAAGAVPIVINKGGQTELVEHGRTGFLWNTVAELKSYTSMLAHDRGLWARMSKAARARASDFRGERFVQKMSGVCGVPLKAGGEARISFARLAALGPTAPGSPPPPGCDPRAPFRRHSSRPE
jgi:glycosyltransferase involved in cell wall biosynthesis